MSTTASCAPAATSPTPGSATATAESLPPRERKILFIQALQEKRRRAASAPLKYWEPHAGQQSAIRGKKDKRILLVTAGNRWGKSVVNAVFTICHAYGYWIFDVPRLKLTADGDYPPRDEIPPEYWIRRPDGVPIRANGTVQIISGLSLDKGIGNVMWPKLEELIPLAVKNAPGFRVVRGPMGVPVRIEFPQGGVVRLGSAEQGAFAYEGAANDAIGIDEPIPRAVFTAVWRGMVDYFAPMWATFTPLGSNAPWMYKEFVANPRDDVHHVTGPQTDNPHLTAEALKEFTEGVEFSDEEAQARRFGRFGFLSHRAYPTFDRSLHTVDPFPIPRHWPKVCACDPANRRPFFFVWAAWDARRETWIVYNEWPKGVNYLTLRTSDKTVADYATIIRNLEGHHRIAKRWIDPRFGVAEYAVKGERSTSVVDDFARYGLFFDPRVPDTGRIETGIHRVRELLRFDRDVPLGPTNQPHLRVFNDCTNVIEGFENWGFVPPDARDDRILAEKVMEAYKDPMDALRYLALGGPPPPISQGYIPAQKLARHNNFTLRDI